MFSFKTNSGVAIARIDGGRHDGKIIYLLNKKSIKSACCDKCRGGCIGGKKCCDKCGKFDGCKGSELVIQHIDKFKKSEGKDMTDKQLNMLEKLLENYTKEYDDNQTFDELIIDDDGVFQPLPYVCEEQTDRIYVAGPSGSGKSTYCSKYIAEYQKMFPKNEFIIFSRVSEDKPLDKLKPIRIPIDEELLDNPMNEDEYKNSIMLFDDIDTVKNVEVRKSLQNLRDDVLETGRHDNAYVVSTAHLINNNKATRAIVNESNSITFFPQSSGGKAIKYFLEVYAGLDKKAISKVFDEDSRWCTIRKLAPQLLIFDKRICTVRKWNKDSEI